jgi:uracil-DNA glycosylase
MLVIGQEPGRGKDEPLSGRAGKKLAQLAGLSLDDFLKATERINLLPRWWGKNGKGDRAPERLLRNAARQLIHSDILDGRTVLVVGLATAKALDHEAVGRRTWHQITIPHPSGINHWWNEPKNEQLASRVLRMFLAGAPHP